MKRVLHITNHIGVDRGGGIKSFIQDVLFYNDNYFKNYLIFSGSSNDLDSLGIPLNTKAYRFKFSLFSKGDKISIFKLFKIIKDVDVLHQHSVWRLNSIISIIFSLFFKTKVIVQPHGAFMPYALSKKAFIKKIYYWFVEYFNLRFCDYILVNSLAEKQFFMEKFDPDKIKLIPLGVKSNFVSDNKNLKFSNNQVKFCFISRLDPIKGLEVLIDSVALLEKKLKDNIIIYIAGNGENEYVDVLKNKIISLGLDNNFVFVGFLNENQKKEILDKSHFFILPSYSESFSLSTVEALARGNPVLTTTGTPWKDIIPMNNCGIIFEPNQISLKESLIKVFDMTPDSYQLFTKNAIRLVKGKYIFENNIKLLNKLYLD